MLLIALICGLTDKIWSLLADMQRWTCTYQSGADLFKGANQLILQRNGRHVSIKNIRSLQILHITDEWTYQVTVDSHLGLRAMRFGGDRYDSLFGGELFLVAQEEVTNLLVVGSNAALMSSESALYLCKNDPNLER